MLTIVCVHCHAGWESEAPIPCASCGSEGQIRGSYTVIDLRARQERIAA